MAVFISTLGRVSNIRQNTVGQSEVVNFKLGARGPKDKQGNDVYFNYDCAAWGALGTKLILPYVKEGDYLEVHGELISQETWESNGKKGINNSLKLASVSLVPRGQAGSETNDNLADTVAAAATNPNVSPAVENVPF